MVCVLLGRAVRDRREFTITMHATHTLASILSLYLYKDKLLKTLLLLCVFLKNSARPTEHRHSENVKSVGILILV